MQCNTLLNKKKNYLHRIEPTTEPATEPPSSTTVLPVRPQPFRPRLFNKTKRVVIPLRERPSYQNAGILSKRQIKKRAAPSK